jgi:hypothetical protein
MAISVQRALQLKGAKVYCNNHFIKGVFTIHSVLANKAIREYRAIITDSAGAWYRVKLEELDEVRE